MLRQMHDQIDRLRRATTPLSVQLFDQAHRLHVHNFASPAWLENVQSFDRQMRASALGEALLPGTKLGESLSKLTLTSDALAVLDASAAARLRAHVRTWNGVSKIQELADRAQGFNAVAAIALGIGEQASLSAATIDRLLAPVGMLTRLGRRTAKLVEAAPVDSRQRIARTLEIIESEVTAHLAVIADGVSDATIDEDELFAPDRPLALGRRQQDEMLAAADVGDGAGQLIAAAPSSRVVALAREIMELVFRINQASQARGGSDIFKPTNRLLQAFLRLPWLDAHTESLLGDVVDDLYFTLYEGAGKDKLRFLRDHGGPLDRDGCDVVFCIKHLRNKWLRHDPEHGSKKEIEKSYATLSGQVQRLGLPRLPRNPADYRLLQRNLLAEVRSFLETLLAALDLVT
jgi:hypothetical protein